MLGRKKLEKSDLENLHFDDLFVERFCLDNDKIELSFAEYFIGQTRIEISCKLTISYQRNAKFQLANNNIKVRFTDFGIIDMVWKLDILEDSICIEGNYINGSYYELTISNAELFFEEIT